MIENIVTEMLESGVVRPNISPLEDFEEGWHIENVSSLSNFEEAHFDFPFL